MNLGALSYMQEGRLDPVIFHILKVKSEFLISGVSFLLSSQIPDEISNAHLMVFLLVIAEKHFFSVIHFY